MYLHEKLIDIRRHQQFLFSNKVVCERISKWNLFRKKKAKNCFVVGIYFIVNFFNNKIEKFNGNIHLRDNVKFFFFNFRKQ